MLDRHLDWVEKGVPAEGDSLSPHAHGPDYRIEDCGYKTPCWVWLKFKLRGYGRTSFFGKAQWAHRAYYEAAIGPIPAGMHLHHRCETPACVNPQHLEVTPHGLHLAYHKQEASSLTWEIVREIREVAKTGVKHAELRLRYGIAQPTLSDIVTGKTWKDAAYVPGFVAYCALPECGAEFAGRGAHKKFCCKEHRLRFNSRMGWRRRNWGDERKAA